MREKWANEQAMNQTREKTQTKQKMGERSGEATRNKRNKAFEIDTSKEIWETGSHKVNLILMYV